MLARTMQGDILPRCIVLVIISSYMKKVILGFVLFVAFGANMKVRGQEIVADSVKTETVAAQQGEAIDSLRQALKALEERVETTEQEKLYEKKWKSKAKFLHIGYVTDQTLTGDMVKLNSKFGVSLTTGRTYWLHKKPLWGMIKFGLDLSFSDINFVMYKDEFNFVSEEDVEEEDEEEFLADLGSLQLEYGVRVGPSLTINPVGELKVNGYFHFVPSFSMLKLDEEFYYNYASFFTAGGSIGYKSFSVGAEWRWAKAKYDGFNADFMEMDFDDEEYDEDIPSIGEIIDDMKISDKFKTKSFRVYVNFRF